MGEGLKNNHTLLGLHMDGNAGSLDAYGHLSGDACPWPLETAHCMTRITGSKIVGKENWTLRNNCWICCMWRETVVTYNTTKKDVKTAKRALGVSEVLLGINTYRISRTCNCTPSSTANPTYILY